MTVLESLRSQRQDAEARAQSIYNEFAQSSNEQMEASQMAAYRAALATVASLGSKIAQEESSLLFARGNARTERAAGSVQILDLGTAFTASDAYKRYRDNGNQGRFAAELSASLLTPTSGGGDAIRIQQVPGITPQLWQAPTFLESLLVLPVSTSSVSMVEQDTTTNAADYHDNEGSEIAEAEFSLSEVVEAVKTIAVALPVSNAVVEDSPAIEGLIRQQLPQMLAAKAEAVVLSGTAPGIVGVLSRSGLPSLITATASENYIDVILRAAAALETANPGVIATHVALHPSDYATIAGSKTEDGVYHSGSPFAPLNARTIFGLVPVKAAAITQGTALVYSTLGALILMRKNIVVSVSDQQKFSSNVTIVKAEMRLGLATPRKSLFQKVDLTA